MDLIGNIQTCKELVESSVPLTAIYYSHIGLAIASFFIGGFVLLHNRSRVAILLSTLATTFSLWAVTDIFLWTSTDSRVYMYLWPIANLLEVLIFLNSLIFFFAFTKEKRNTLIDFLAFLLILPVIALIWTPNNLAYFDVTSCTPIEAWFWEKYISSLEFIITSWVAIVGFYKVLKLPQGPDRRVTLLFTIGLTLFLISFLLAGWVVDLSGFNYIYEIVAFIGTGIFLWFLSYLIVRFSTFNIKVLGAQALVIALVGAVASQFLYIRNPVNYSLNAVALALVIVFGFLLMRSVQREVEQRERIERLATDLKRANDQQVILIHFITHQIKGFVTKSRNIFASLREGDYGKLPDTIVPLVEEGFRSDTKGAQTIQEILNAANIKSGKVVYTMAEFDLRALIEEIAKDLQTAAEAKGLALTLDLGTQPLLMKGDRGQLVNAFKNLIDNSIKYTPSGSVTVTLGKAKDGHIMFSVRDTGVGITKEDMEHLFTEGGHGKNSQKINVESTGFGLYIVKNIIEAHKGTVRADSAGEGKGSTFTVELPI